MILSLRNDSSTNAEKYNHAIALGVEQIEIRIDYKYENYPS